MSFFRYPGVKSKLRNSISAAIKSIANHTRQEYREPFFGGGGGGLAVLRGVPTIRHLWLNDLDAGIACLWTAVIRCPQPLMDRIERFVPSVGAFDDYRAELLSAREMPVTDKEVARIGFMKLAIHQISYSGLGVKSGGPLGGRTEGNVAGGRASVRYPIDCRWNPGKLIEQINRLHALLRVFSIREDRCTCLDFAEVISDTERDAILYLDPPYYVQGAALYQHGFTVADHERLAGLLRSCPHPWVLSYDDCPEIRRLYDGKIIEEININYSITTEKTSSNKRQKNELLIYPSKQPCFYQEKIRFS